MALGQNANRLIMQGDGNLVLYLEDSYTYKFVIPTNSCMCNKMHGSESSGLATHEMEIILTLVHGF